MAIGPCLCGDPSCPHCGDPSAAVYEAAIDALDNALFEKRLNEEALNQDADINMIGDDSAFFDGDIGNK